jgi:Tfp pilus assembly protein PilF
MIIKSNPHFAEAYCDLASIYNQNGNQEEAERFARKALLFAPDSADAHKAHAFVLFSKNQLENAKSEFETASTIDPDDGETFACIGDICILQR